MKITVNQILKMERAANRLAMIEAGLNINHHRVIKSKKSYSRKEGKKVNF